MIRPLRLIRLAVLAMVAALLIAPPAAAHDVRAGADLRIAQTIAGAELTLVIKATTRVPGPLRVEVIGFPAAPALDLRLRSMTGGGVTRGTAAPGRPARLRAEETGPHELSVTAGGETTVIPFRVLVDRGSGWEFLIYGGLFTAGLLLVGGLLTGAFGRRGRSAFVVTAVAAAGLTVAALIVVLDPWLPAGPPDGAEPRPTDAPAGRPYVQRVITTVPARPAPGEEFVARVELFDGSTGRPVDDLAVHHEAMAHLVVTAEDGRYFRHVHPLRTAPGRLEVRLRAGPPGRYLTYVELERTDSGGQLLTGAFTVGGRDAADPGDGADGAGADVADADVAGDAGAGGTGTDAGNGTASGTGTGSGNGARSGKGAGSGSGAGATAPGDPEVPAAPAGTVTVTPAVPRAGRPATVEVATAGTPLPWLGMAGHLIVRSADGGFLGHVHEMGTPGARLRFTFGFPVPGRYLAWAQYATGRGITTVPFTVEVPR
ncbi:hypothetical protein Sru01_59820 [Sphaerisporangium rufum]|uniref:Secreted protein n=1 Tax=Sphaerisporangium rufum TaxID=1381558 RepID=A0A919V841_9ACTN|nr:hypothetical protein [Sphaerisporangium rufum]GII81000.1 hypothetical protein Sru01_59820 [Sphaerisporangium rufum]